MKAESTKSHRSSEEDKKQHYLRREFSYSNYQQTYVLPDDIVIDHISAKVDDGVLTFPQKKTPVVILLKNSRNGEQPIMTGSLTISAVISWRCRQAARASTCPSDPWYRLSVCFFAVRRKVVANWFIPVQKIFRKHGVFALFRSLLFTLIQRFSGRTSKHPYAVRPDPLTPYDQRPFERTSWQPHVVRP